MTARDHDLPVARTVPDRRAWLKDPAFLMEVGAAIAFLGIFLSMAVIVQRDHEELAKDGAALDVFLVLLQVTFLLATAGGVMAWMQARVGSAPPKAFLRYLLEMICGVVVSGAIAMLVVNGVTCLILPLQMFFAWLGLSAGFTLVLVARQRMRAAAAASPPTDAP